MDKETLLKLFYADIWEKYIDFGSDKLNRKLEQRRSFLIKNNYLTEADDITSEGVKWIAKRYGEI